MTASRFCETRTARTIRHFAAALALPAVLLSGCAHYTALPLARAPALAPAPPAAPLSINQVVARAIADNPDLAALRLQRAVAAGQTRQAGILPNPSLSGAFLPLLSGVGTVPAWNIGIAQDLKTIITYRSRRQAAADSEQQIAADVVWQEWQVAGAARQIAAELILVAQSRPTYLAAYRLLADRNIRLDQALDAHSVTLVTVAPDRVALQAARSALDTLDQRQLSLMHQLDALLGLAPDVVVALAETPGTPAFDPAAIRAGLATLADRRPDLLALRLGYAAADEQVRAAIIAQFPDLILGGSGSSDNSRVINAGPTAQIGLPLFDRNQGNIAIARATRAQLHAAYAARLAQAVGTVGAMLGEIEQLRAQLAIAQKDLPAAQAAARRAQAAFGQSNLDERGYVDLVTNSFTREQDIMTLELALRDRENAVRTLVGEGLPTAGVQSR